MLIDTFSCRRQSDYSIIMLRAIVLSAALFVAAAEEDYMVLRAIVKMAEPKGSTVNGIVKFEQTLGQPVQVTGNITGLSKGEYGFHVHEKGDITGGCLSTLGHFNPEHKHHGHPEDAERHVGDLGNVKFDENKLAIIDITDNQISLIGSHSIIGRALVLHERADDFGKTDHPDSRKTGNAGGRVACGVIGIL